MIKKALLYYQMFNVHNESPDYITNKKKQSSVKYTKWKYFTRLVLSISLWVTIFMPHLQFL